MAQSCLRPNLNPVGPAAAKARFDNSRDRQRACRQREDRLPLSRISQGWLAVGSKPLFGRDSGCPVNRQSSRVSGILILDGKNETRRPLRIANKQLPNPANGIEGLLIQRAASQRQHRDMLRSEVFLVADGAAIGDFLQASADVLRAELDLCESQEQRIACHKQTVKYLRDLEEQVNSGVKAVSTPVLIAGK